MKIAVSGASGLIGRAFVSEALSQGHAVLRLVRRPAGRADEVPWNPQNKILDVAPLEGVDAVVHLAGENIAGRWTDDKRRRILESRVVGTKLLVDGLDRLRRRPEVLVCASATGFYGNRGDQRLTERSEPGEGFLADVCRQWESAARAAEDFGVRVVTTRFGMVLSGTGGALPAMLPPFRFGLGAVLGDGRQHIGWVAIEDAAAAILLAITDPKLRGPVNVVAPQVVTNRQFTRTLARVLHRPAFMRLPAGALRLLLGQMADEVLLASAHVEPEKLLAAGFKFTYPDLEPALQHLLAAKR